MTSAKDTVESFTPQQRAAVEAEGNVLVIAGAGTGKTRTLVERCARCVLDRQASLSEIVMVTFTEAAAAEMRRRIRERLEQACEERPELSEQVALLETAHIRTLHSFCHELVRQHFYELGLDPQLTVLSEQQSRVLQEETFDALFQEAYTDAHPSSVQIRALIRTVGQGRDSAVRDLVRAIHEHTQTRPDPAAWFEREAARLRKPDPATWKRWLFEGAQELYQAWTPLLAAEPTANLSACTKILGYLEKCDSEVELRSLLERIKEIDASDWEKQKQKVRKPYEAFFADVDFLWSLTAVDGSDPIAQDWLWNAPSLRTLLDLAREFASRFEAARRAGGGIDFHDLEQGALRLLWHDGAATELARDWQRQFKLVFVDEYQDINPAQDQILRALSRSGAEANRFLVGDMKQSVYRFRQADPGIFQGYAAAWRQASGASTQSEQRFPLTASLSPGGREQSLATPGVTLPLSENFRSREGLIEFVNAFFGPLMSAELGGLDYNKEGHLLFGDPAGRADLAKTFDTTPRTEVILGLTGGENGDDDERTNAEREARTVALRLKELKRSGTLIRDEMTGTLRPVEWKDMVILLRAASGKVEAFAKEFDRAGVPLQATGSGLFESIEVQDFLNLLTILDNPLQDQPLLAVLHSPLAGLTPSDLAEIRLAARKTEYWTALDLWHRGNKGSETATYQKVDTFLERFHRWRSMARFSSLPQRLEEIIEETHYLDWLTTQSRADQRRANVQHLISLAREFDQIHRQSLHRFLQIVSAEQEAAGDREPPPGATIDSVRLMTIHRSKGLEFPIVVIPDLGKKFNFSDMSGEIILDPELGLCGKVRAPETGQAYPSLPFWLARQRQTRQILSEELRLLYVGMTRAQELLILSGISSEKRAGAWSEAGPDYNHPCRLRRARSYLDWLGPWLARHAPANDWLDKPEGNASCWCWRTVRVFEADPAPIEVARNDKSETVSREEFSRLLTRLEWSYPFNDATTQPAKTSVTMLRREAADGSEAATPFGHPGPLFNAPGADPKPNAADIGLATHLFLERADLAEITNRDGAAEEAKRLVKAGVLSEEQVDTLDLRAIQRFWNSAAGTQILSHRNSIARELRFTVRLTAETAPTISLLSRIPKGEFIVMQGAVDLAVMLPTEIWIVDFKTDQAGAEISNERLDEYKIQLQLYGIALAQIYGKPVTRRWLQFLKSGETIEVAAAASEPLTHATQLSLWKTD